jgi:hypothetical protein
MIRISMLALAIVCGISSGCSEVSRAETKLPVPTPEQTFDKLLAKYPNLTFQQLTKLTEQPPYANRLSFDPSVVKFYDEAVKQLLLTDAEQAIFRKQGFVSVDHGQRYSFGSLYYAIYTRDLPVLVTTDSILHALHRTYDDVLMELEQTFFTAALDELLSKCHEELASVAPGYGRIAQNCRDVDLYLTVARNLLKGAGAPVGDRIHPGRDAWNGAILVRSKLDQDVETKEILDLVRSLELQSALRGEFTHVYGGKRSIDYSQFQPRGHYAKTAALSRYFRAMMWLGRADTGWNVLPPDRQSGIVSDSPRELRNAVLLTELLQSTGAVERLRQMSEIIDFLVGESDNLTVFEMLELMRKNEVGDVGDLVSSHAIENMQDALRKSDMATQQIRSQVIVSDPNDLYQVPPPGVYQLFGQRFMIDSFVLSKVVYDSIIFNGEKVKRKMPTGLDVMFALGNDSALPLLEKELTKFPYASNLKAGEEFVGTLPQDFWRQNLYNVWLDSLRSLTIDVSAEKHLPEVMRTETWQRKQLQTQLASWTELRHDTVLYAKQSYTASELCEYPTGYVEPYPETYARIKFFAEEAARRLEVADYKLASRDFTDMKNRQVEFFNGMADTLGRLETLARKELSAQPFTDEDQLWLKKLIDIRSRGSGAPTYSGWYCQLFYGGGHRSAEWEPTIVDVHTDPDSKSVLEQAVGNCNFLIVAVDNEDDRMIYVGPAYSYYEFRQPASERLTDELWVRMIATQSEPARPTWTNSFQAPKVTRHLKQH